MLAKKNPTVIVCLAIGGVCREYIRCKTFNKRSVLLIFLHVATALDVILVKQSLI